MTDEKECFFISPIGDDGSDIRKRSDKVMEYVIEEALSDFDYSVTRADKMDEPGSITNQIIRKIVNSDLVIADLTGHNPNVFYELAVRHATGEPFIQLIDSNESIPFDVNDDRTIHYGLGVEEADRAKRKIRSQLEMIRDDDPKFDNPVSRSAEMQSLHESEDPADQNLADLLETVSKIDRKVNRMQHRLIDNQRPSSHRSPEEETKRIRIDDNVLTLRDDTVSSEFVEEIAEKHDISTLKVSDLLRSNGIEIQETFD
jgi:hypothetical protein